jgi:lysophospholipase L1-like esterase
VDNVARAEPSVSWKAQVLLALAGVVFALAVAESALRATRFHFDLVPSLQFGWPDAQALQDAYVSDPDLVWVTRNYRETLRGARRSHPAIVFMGDSCTEFSSYPRRTLQKLQADASIPGTGVTLGVGGWSSEQGLEQLRRDVIPLHPAVITIYYGWNDHWVAMGLTDPEIMHAHRLRWLADRLRLGQLWLEIDSNLAARRKPAPNRVPLLHYVANLRAIATEARAAGIIPIFITAPSNHVAGHEPAYLLKRHVRSLSEVVPLHTEYMDATRAAALDAGAQVCDAAAAFTALPEPHNRFFQKDGIHLTDEGDEEMARIVAGCLVKKT